MTIDELMDKLTEYDGREEVRIGLASGERLAVEKVTAEETDLGESLATIVLQAAETKEKEG
jgi:hypothetical protein